KTSSPNRRASVGWRPDKKGDPMVAENKADKKADKAEAPAKTTAKAAKPKAAAATPTAAAPATAKVAKPKAKPKKEAVKAASPDAGVQKFGDYLISKKRSGRYEVIGKDGKNVN